MQRLRRDAFHPEIATGKHQVPPPRAIAAPAPNRTAWQPATRRRDVLRRTGSFDLVDALFLNLGRGRTPAAAHVFLAQLVDAFRVRVFLSLNFDPFLETALWDEGHAPNVIEVAKDSDLPSREAIRDRLTVLKLHGGPYGLRIGERIYETADANTLQRASRIVREDALVVVMGFSGDERRITQVLIDHAAFWHRPVVAKRERGEVA